MDTLSNDDVYQINRLNLLKALKEHGVETVTVSFDGGGDEGQIYEIGARKGGTEIVDITTKLETPFILHEVRESFTARFRGIADPDRKVEDKLYDTLADVIEAICYQLLDKDNAGWGNNDGAYGEFEIDVAAQTIELNFNARISSSEFYGYAY